MEIVRPPTAKTIDVAVEVPVEDMTALDEGRADASLRILAPMGLVFDENSPWLSVSACAGSPGCEHSAADVRADAAAAVESGDLGARHRHYVGCERACGSPLDAEVLIATDDGYRPRDT